MPNTSASGGLLPPIVLSPPLEDAALDDIFQSLIVGLTGLSPTLVRPRWQTLVPKQPEPVVNWCAIGVVSEKPDANACIQHDGAANGGLGRDNLYRHEEIQVLATFYGLNAKAYAKEVRDGMYIEQNHSSLRQYGMAFINTENIRAIPELLNEQWVKRYDLPMNFRRVIIRSYDVQNILTADITLYNQVETVNIHIEE